MHYLSNAISLWCVKDGRSVSYAFGDIGSEIEHAHYWFGDRSERWPTSDKVLHMRILDKPYHAPTHSLEESDCAFGLCTFNRFHLLLRLRFALAVSINQHVRHVLKRLQIHLQRYLRTPRRLRQCHN